MTTTIDDGVDVIPTPEKPDDNSPSSAAVPTPSATKSKVTFTPEQQEKIDTIVKEAMGRASREKTQEIVTLNSKLTDLERDLAEAKQAVQPDARTKEYQAVVAKLELKNEQALQELFDLHEHSKQMEASKDAEIARHKAASEDVHLRSAISNAASKVGFVNNEQVFELTHRFVRRDADTGQYRIYDPAGSVRLNAAYEPMTLEEYYTEFAASMPHMVRANARGGAGSVASVHLPKPQPKGFEVTQIFGSKSDSRLANDLARLTTKNTSG